MEQTTTSTTVVSHEEQYDDLLGLMNHAFTTLTADVRTRLYEWRAACRRAGITEKFRFHDVRHTWASWHVQGGTPLNRLMELGGWSSYDMVLRYAHLAPDHLAEHADTVLLNAVPAPTLAIVS